MKDFRKVKFDGAEQGIDFRDLLAQYKLLKDLMDFIPDVIYFKDKQGRLIMVNKAHAKGLGLTPEEVVGKTDFDIFPKERAKKMWEDDSVVLTAGKPIIDKIERATRADGLDNYVSTTKIPRYDEEGNIVGLIGITRDITKRMQYEHLEQEKEKLEEKIKALKEVNNIKSEFVSVVSHELRTPLAVIKEAIKLIADRIVGPVSNKQEELLSKACNNAERLNKIIEELLDISRIESGKFKLHYSLINLNDLLREFSEFFKQSCEKQNIKLTYKLPGSQVNIFLDAERISQVLNNLITNALKFTESGGRIIVGLDVLENKIRLQVSDTGIGIAKQDLPKLFNKFTQVSKNKEAERKGVGLGLAIAKEIVSMHNGEIWAESKLGVGTTFYFTLPQLYTVNTLDGKIREKMNGLLKAGVALYLINILIVNFSEFKRRLKIDNERLACVLEAIIAPVLNNLGKKDQEKPQVVLADKERAEFSILAPALSGGEANKICNSLKESIHKYFAKSKIKDVFINIAAASYPQKLQPKPPDSFSAGINIKKLYIGAEVRRFARINYRVPIEIMSAENKAETFQTIDISNGGVSFAADTALKANSIIGIRLKMPNDKSLQLKGRVAWLRYTAEPFGDRFGGYRVGLEFINLKIKDKRAISGLVEKISG
jgi:PAS domain S-box-containing protein